MKLLSLTFVFLLLAFTSHAQQRDSLQRDVIKTSEGELTITFIAHGSLLFSYQGKEIYIDPSGLKADFTGLPKADLILVTHQHQDHFNPKTIDYLSEAGTAIVLNEKAQQELAAGQHMSNGEVITVKGLKIEAVPAYNVVHRRENGEFYHPKGMGNGYVLTFADKRVLVAGDTENIPEIKELKDIDVAFLPMNLPYTMTPAMVADAVKAMRPRIFYVYHYGDSDLDAMKDLLKDEKDVDVRVRKM